MITFELLLNYSLVLIAVAGGSYSLLGIPSENFPVNENNRPSLPN